MTTLSIYRNGASKLKIVSSNTLKIVFYTSLRIIDGDDMINGSFYYLVI